MKTNSVRLSPYLEQLLAGINAFHTYFPPSTFLFASFGGLTGSEIKDQLREPEQDFN